MFRGDQTGKNTIGLSASEAGVTLVLGLLLVSHIYFAQGKFEFTTTTKVLLVSTLVICLLMAPRFVIVMKDDRIWWGPVVLEIVVAHLIIYIQMLIERLTWEEKRRKWHAELKFVEEYQKGDQSESAIRLKLS